jgi:hypothetical protein
MPETFKCPTCAAPLRFEGKMLQDCKYCGGSIIVPAELFQKKPIQPEPKVIKLNEVLNTVFSSINLGQQHNVVIDLRSSSKRAQQSLYNIHSDLQAGDQSHAVSVFTETFGVNSNDARKAVSAMVDGKGFDASAMRIYPEVGQKSVMRQVMKIVIGFLILMVVIPLFIFALVFLLAYFAG